MLFARVIAAATLSLTLGLAQAAPVTFHFDSTVTVSDLAGGNAFDPAFTVGTPLAIAVTFDPAAALVLTRNDGQGNPRVFDFAAGSIAMTISGGGATQSDAFDPNGGGLLRLRDNAWNPDCGTGNDFTNLCAEVDGLTWVLFGADQMTQWSLIVRGTTLDLVNGANLPAVQDPRWARQEIAQFSICRTSIDSQVGCDLGNLIATISAVPAPSTLALAALGVFALASRRRQAARR